MLTAMEIQHIKNVLTDLSALADPSEYTQQEVWEAIDLLDKIKPIDCMVGLDIFERQIELEDDELFFSMEKDLL